SLLMDGFADTGSTSWRTRADALEAVHESLSADRVSRVALDDAGSVAGWIGGLPTYAGHVWELHPLVVRRNSRGQGIGRALVPGRAPMNKQEFAALSRVPPGTTPPQIDSRSEIQEIVVAGDVAFMWTRLSMVMTPPGGQPIERAGHTLSVLQRVNGRWLLAR